MVQTEGVAKGTFYLYFATKDDPSQADSRMVLADGIDMAPRAIRFPGFEHEPVLTVEYA
jgi:hypothetical protein